MKKLILLLLFIPLVFSCSDDPIKYTLTTSVNPVDSGAVNPNGGTVDEGQQISVTATPAAEYVFDKWTGAASGTSTTVSIIMDSDKSVTANFIKKKYALTTSVEGEGTITEKIIKAGASTDYNSGTIVELTATPKVGWKFKEWQGDLTGTDNPKQITIDKAKTVKAVFETDTYTTTIHISFSGYGSGLNEIGELANGGRAIINGMYVGFDNELVISDYLNYRVLKYTGSSPIGEVISKAGTFGTTSDGGLFTNGDMMGDFYGVLNEAIEAVIKVSPSSDKKNEIFFGNNGAGDGLNQLKNPQGMCYNGNYGVFIADTMNDRILFIEWGDESGKVVAGGNGRGSALNQLHWPSNVEVDNDGNIFVADPYNGRIIKWEKDADVGIVVSEKAGYDLAMDENFLYTSTMGDNPSIYRISKSNKDDIILISGGNGKGSNLNQYDRGQNIDIDRFGNIYVSDGNNLRIMKITKD